MPHTVLVRTTSCYFKFALQSRQVKRTPQDSINELNIWKMNLLIIPVTIVKFKSAFLHAQWAVNILRELPSIWSDWKSLNGLNLLEDIYIKFRETELVEISQLNCMWIHSSLHTQECRDESEIYNYPWIQLSNNEWMGSWGVCLTWLDCNL